MATRWRYTCNECVLANISSINIGNIAHGHGSTKKIATPRDVTPDSSRTINCKYETETARGYFAYLQTTPASNQHGTSVGSVEITNVCGTRKIHNDTDDKKFVSINVKNVGGDVVGFDLDQRWVTEIGVK